MRTSRVFYLFLSVVQFIFFLKLVEYVRGEEIPTAGISDAGSIQNNPTEKDDLPRGMFIAPNIKRKKQRTDLGKSSNNTESDVPGNSSGRIDEAEVNNSTLKRRNQYEKEVARLCPVRFFFWTFCPLDMPFFRLFFPEEMRAIYHESQAKKRNNVTVDPQINSDEIY